MDAGIQGYFTTILVGHRGLAACGRRDRGGGGVRERPAGLFHLARARAPIAALRVAIVAALAEEDIDDPVSTQFGRAALRRAAIAILAVAVIADLAGHRIEDTVTTPPCRAVEAAHRIRLVAVRSAVVADLAGVDATIATLPRNTDAVDAARVARAGVRANVPLELASAGLELAVGDAERVLVVADCPLWADHAVRAIPRCGLRARPQSHDYDQNEEPTTHSLQRRLRFAGLASLRKVDRSAYEQS